MLRRITLGGIAIALVLIPLLAMDEPAEARMGHSGAVYVQEGKASWYGSGFHGRKTASGERFNPHRLTAAHRRLPLGTKAKVTNLHNGRTVEVEITDRGPYVRGRIIDLSKAAAERLGMKRTGTTLVLLEVTKLPSGEEGRSG
jgi:rare lipoprotein A